MTTHTDKEKTLNTVIQHEETRLYLLVVLDAHTDGVDQDGDHDASVEVLALHDSPQLHPRVVPQLPATDLGTTSPMSPCPILAFLSILLISRMNPLPVRFLHSSLLCLIIRTANRSHSIVERQGSGTLRATVGGRGRGEGHG